MPFHPQALSERTLKSFVDTLVSLRKKSAGHHPKNDQRADPPRLRAQCQEEVAKMLGFKHWHAAIEAIRKKSLPPQESRSEGTAKDLSEGWWRYADAPEKFDEEAARSFLRWAVSKDVFQVSTGLGENPGLSVCHPSFQGRGKVSVESPIGPAGVDAFAQAAGARMLFDYAGAGNAKVFTTIDGDRWSMSADKDRYFLMTRHSRGHALFPDQRDHLTKALPVLLDPSKKGVWVVAARTWVAMQTLEQATERKFLVAVPKGARETVRVRIEALWAEGKDMPEQGVYHDGLCLPQSYFHEKQAEALKGKPGELFLRRCNDEKTLTIASECGRDRMVYVGLSPGRVGLDTRFQRVSETLVVAFELFSPDRWQQSAIAWTSQLKGISVYLPLGEPLSRLDVGVFETLALDDQTLSEIHAIIRSHEKPREARPALARLVLERGEGFLENLENQGLKVSAAKRRRLAQAEEAWRARWQAAPASKSRPHL